MEGSGNKKRAAVDATAVQQSVCFQGLDEHEAGQAAQHLEPLQLAPGKVLFRQGDASDAGYFLLSGTVEIRATVPDQGDRLLSTLEAGALFGEIGLLLKEPRTATIVAATDVALWRIPEPAFEAALHQNHAWANRVLLAAAQGLARRLGNLTLQVVGMLAETQANEPRTLSTRVAELEELRNRLLTEWSF